jgi:hypothetical protein
MHHEPAQIIAGAMAQAVGCWQVTEIEFSRVVHSQYDWHLLHAAKRLTNMRTQHTVSVDLRIIEKAVPSLECCAIEGLWKRTLRRLRELARKSDQTLSQASVAQLRRAKLVTRPVIEIVRVRQSYRPPQDKLHGRQVNIVRGSLQAATHGFVGKDQISDGGFIGECLMVIGA